MSKELERRELMRWSGQSVPQLTQAQKLATWIDSKLAIVAPQWAANRLAARAGMAVFSAYRGGSTDRLMGSWLPSSGSADADIWRDLKLTRQRARDLVRNNPIAAGAASSITIQTIGPGIRVQSNIDAAYLGFSGAQADAFKKDLERGWRLWSEKYCDCTGRMTLEEMQALVFQNILVNGEQLVQLLRLDVPGRPFDLALELIESDRLETPYKLMGDPTIRNGVKLGPYGEPVQYFIRKHHPGDVFLPYHPVDPMDYLTPMAKNSLGQPNILHLFWQERSGQNRGMTKFAPVLEMFESLASLHEARLVRARVAACFTAFITKSDPISAFGQLQANQKGERLASMQPGRIEYLAHGEDVKFSNAQASNTGEDAFVEESLTAIATGLGLPYEMLVKNWRKTNYSSARAALLEARRFFRFYQRWFAFHFIRPCWEVLQQERAMRGEIRADLFGPMKDEYLRVKFNLPGFGWVDPDKEITAAGKAISYGLSCASDEIGMATGRDVEEVYDELAREAKMRKDRGLPDPQLPTVGRPADKAAPTKAEGADTSKTSDDDSEIETGDGGE